MGVRFQQEGGESHLALRDVVDVSQVRELHRLALEAVEATGGVTVSLDEAARVDTAAGQVLLALRRALAGRGRVFTLEAPLAGIPEAWRFLGFDGEPE